MRKRIFYSICAVALACLLLFSVCVVALVYSSATRDGFENLRSGAATLATGYQAQGQAFLQQAAPANNRITLIAPDGTVLYDNRENPATLENHAGRPEVAAAMQTGAGSAQRMSGTFGERQLYHALRLADGNILRLAMEADSVLAQALRLVPWLLLIAVGLVAAASLAARWISGKLLRPLARLDLDDPLGTQTYDELAPLLRKLAAQQQRIAAQLAEMQARRQEFELVTDCMDEGLIVLGARGQVLSLNASARRILNTDADIADAPPLLSIARDLVLDEAVKQVLAGQGGHTVLEAAGRHYQVLLNPTRQGGTVTGAVLLLVDETEKLQAEQHRREFTANVSHELKTPLTSISGYAELIQTGTAKPEDVAGFAGRIQAESSRLVALVEDIIRLSRLDEKDPSLQKVQVELLGLAEQVAESLAPAAAQKETALLVNGEGCAILGAPSILTEILYNLAENAIRYSPPRSTVTIRVQRQPGGARLVVEDDGPGIPPQHRQRVFERFYRVDKSHSRQSGGTGLGLAIVKNGARFHGGTVELEPARPRGSRFIVTLPLAGN